VGYLLARATDTVADTTTLPQTDRLQLLKALMAAIDSPDGELQSSQHALTAFAERQADPHERALMKALPACLPLLQALPPDDQASVRWVLGHITRGQVLDVERFGQGPAALATEAELDEYTWLVAGCVGEFWTELCARHLPDFATQSADAMRLAGSAYGMGLQRLNILRDAGADLAAGRCYLPEARLSPLGLSPERLMQAARSGDATTLRQLAPLWNEYLLHTQTQLSEGVFYSQCLTQRRLRLASALPALIGARTVALLRQAGPQALTQRVKMLRHEVRALIWRLLWRLASKDALAREFQRLSQ
jgi:farnesyl-diphosphate farnesyltransferase